jgi:transcriptional regulator with XRE-family HTH domain
MDRIVNRSPKESVDVGERIKSLREEKHMSLRVLSKKSGISANALSLIERNKTSPTVTTLMAVASAFSLSVNDFFSDTDKEKDAFVVYKRSEANSGAVVEAMATNLKNQNLNPLLIRLGYNERFRKELCFHSGDEFIYCLSGEIECEIDSTRIKIGPGDAVTYKAEIPHRIKSVSPSGSNVLVVFEISRLS